ncbi:Adenine phosphoribosyltransferase [Piscirickettsia salmonis]|uniref:adenine phosphoribosyltransferase n=1 Tax=Piscirickettsia salmonis TaxID=1238 RepID=UPI0012BAD08D|nr:adenine phosphoribosyltransferase [Piscirickettsia salmonis]QGP56157.1 Adenine phosphoribosyltransferase [Piscirickettsia salmonis]QGP57975.1 Adenine phosphoribosyltransferase [Piscirickettsia salmonis]QGP65726.1 Adenine phosphoribosyltransferase [Piscirickettsia salmonis]
MKTLSHSDKSTLFNSIRNIPDYPKPGILFKDISTLLNDHAAFSLLIDHLCDYYQDQHIDFVAGIESRGFIFGAILAYKLNAGFVPIRKPGKLPSQTYQSHYELEYGTDTLEIHQDAFRGTNAAKILLTDDLIATGGTAQTAIELINQAGGQCTGACFAVALHALPGYSALSKLTPVYSVLDC